MEKSQFPALVDKWLPVIIELAQKTVNGEDENNRYYYREWTTRRYSVDLKFGSQSVDSSQVTADIISMDAPVPVKRRGSLQSYYGDIPKMGISYTKGERLLADIGIMEARGATEKEIVAHLLDDITKVIRGIHDKNELMFLELLSTGSTVIEEDKNTGTAIRATAHYPEKNQFTPVIDWGQAGYKPISDLKRMVKAAKPLKPRYAIMSQEAYDLLITSQEAKDLVANGIGLLVSDQSRVPVPTSEAFNAAFKKEAKLEIVVIDKTLVAQKDAVDMFVQPFAANSVVLAPSLNLGRHVYGTLPEVKSLETHNKNDINYQIVENFMLVKRYSETNPLKEFTVAEAICIPVIDNVEHIYHLDTTGAAEDAQTEGDSQFTYAGVTYVKSHVIATLATLGVTVSGSATDAELLAAINTLSNQNKNKLKQAFPQVDKHALTFTSAADATGQIVTVSSTGTVTATSSNAFATAAVNGNEVKVTVTLNEGAARTSDVTITQGGKSIIVKVTQAAA